MLVRDAARLAGVPNYEVLRWIRLGVPTGTYRREDRYYLETSKIWNGLTYRHDVKLSSLRKVMALRTRMAEAGKEASGVIIGDQNGNRKIGPAYTTMVAQQTCPKDCRFQGKGCYAEYDNVGTHWRRASRGAASLTPLQLARTEAAMIDRLSADRDIRLHVAGDSATDEGTRLLAGAAARYIGRADKKVGVWAYTHAWRTVPREAWGVISVLASCETVEDVLAAEERGYATSIVAVMFKTFRTHDYLGLQVIPCPAQTHGDRNCVQCRLCFDDKRLLDRKLTIGFETHGSGKKYADKTLNRIALPLAV